MDWISYFEKKMQEKGFNSFEQREEGVAPKGVVEIEVLENSTDYPIYAKNIVAELAKDTIELNASVQKKVWLRGNRRAESCYLANIDFSSPLKSVGITYVIADDKAMLLSTKEIDKTQDGDLSLRDKVWKNIKTEIRRHEALEQKGLLLPIPANLAIDKIVEKFYELSRS